MPREGVDIKERLAVLIMRPRAVARTHEHREVLAKDDPGNAKATEAIKHKKETGR